MDEIDADLALSSLKAQQTAQMRSRSSNTTPG